jgi:NADH-quinone oxidoreductase subunit K
MDELAGSVPLSWYLALSALLFGLGLFGVLARRNAVTILMGVELILNAANLNFVAFWRYVGGQSLDGVVFAMVVMAVAACEAAIGLALIIAIYRSGRTVNIDQINLLQG